MLIEPYEKSEVESSQEYRAGVLSNIKHANPLHRVSYVHKNKKPGLDQKINYSCLRFSILIN